MCLLKAEQCIWLSMSIAIFDKDEKYSYGKDKFMILIGILSWISVEAFCKLASENSW